MREFIVESTKNVSPGVVNLTFRPARPRDAFDFEPGQYISFGFKRGARPSPMRCFSLVNAPDERGYLQITFRVEGPFTQSAARLHRGDRVMVQGPFGEFTVSPRQDRRVVMLAGGIGITPFMSMVRAAKDQYPMLPMTLLYGCPSANDIPYAKELLRLENADPNLQVIFFVSDGSRLPQPGAQVVHGRIDDTWLDKVTSGSFIGSTYFICGPKQMTEALQTQLIIRDIDPSRVITESFTQTSQAGQRGWGIPRITYALAAVGTLAVIGIIMGLDLVRQVPKLVAQQSKSSSTSSSSNSTDDAATNTATSGTTDNTNSTSNTNASTSTSNSNSSTYQQPVSSVS